MATATPPTAAQPVHAKKDRTHYLYIAVIVAVALGIAVGLHRARFRQGSSSRSAPGSSI